MRHSLTIVTIVLAALALARASDVLEIKGQEALHAAIDAHPLLAVAIHASATEAWDKLEPEWAAVAATFKGEAVTLATVDIVQPINHYIVQEITVRKFPSILVWKRHFHERHAVYKGSLDTANITAYLRRRAAPPAVHLPSSKEVADFLAPAGDPGNEEAAYVVAFVPGADADTLAVLQAVGDTVHDSIATAYVTDRSFIYAPCQDPDCDSPVAVLHKAGAAKVFRYDGEFEEVSLRLWAESRATAPVARYSNMIGVKNPGFARASEVRAPHIFGIFKNEDAITPEVVTAFEEAAEANGNLKFFLTTLEQGFMLCDYLGVGEGARTPVFVASEHWKRRRYGKERMDLADLPEFIEEYRQGALPRLIKSEPEGGEDADEYDDGEDDAPGGDEYVDVEDDKDAPPAGVMHVTANSWNVKVGSASKPVLIMFKGSFW